MKKKVKVLGITGGLGSGKTTSTAMFEALGARTIDADKIYRRMIKPQGPVYKRIVSAFGRGILKRNREINRNKLRKIVFDKGLDLKRLCRITHPAIIKKIKQQLSGLKKKRSSNPIVIDAALLIEAGLLKLLDKLIVVKAKQNKIIRRIKGRRKLSAAQIKKIIKAQMPLGKKVKLADYVINNNGTLKQTRKQVKEIWKRFNQ